MPKRFVIIASADHAKIEIGPNKSDLMKELEITSISILSVKKNIVFRAFHTFDKAVVKSLDFEKDDSEISIGSGGISTTLKDIKNNFIKHKLPEPSHVINCSGTEILELTVSKEHIKSSTITKLKEILINSLELGEVEQKELTEAFTGFEVHTLPPKKPKHKFFRTGSEETLTDEIGKKLTFS